MLLLQEQQHRCSVAAVPCDRLQVPAAVIAARAAAVAAAPAVTAAMWLELLANRSVLVCAAAVHIHIWFDNCNTDRDPLTARCPGNSSSTALCRQTRPRASWLVQSKPLLHRNMVLAEFLLVCGY